jgi:hypothetical protein
MIRHYQQKLSWENKRVRNTGQSWARPEDNRAVASRRWHLMRHSHSAQIRLTEDFSKKKLENFALG